MQRSVRSRMAVVLLRCDIYISSEIFYGMTRRIGILHLLHQFMRHLTSDRLRLAVRLLKPARAKALRIHILRRLLRGARCALRAVLYDTRLGLMEFTRAEGCAGSEVRAARDLLDFLHLCPRRLTAKRIQSLVYLLEEAGTESASI